MKKIITGVVSLAITTGCSMGTSELPYSASLSVDEVDFEEQVVIDSNNFKYKNAIEHSWQGLGLDYGEANKGNSDNKPRIGITSHHLPVAADFVAEFYYRFLVGDISEYNGETFVVIGPDHPEKCEGIFTSGKVKYKTNFGLLESDERIVGELFKSGLVNKEAECLEREHSIGVQADYIKMLMPDAKIVPVTVSSSATVEDSLKLSKVLNRFHNEAYFVVSVDFNHYRTEEQAQTYDQETIQAIESMQVDDLSIDNVDSPPSLRIAVELSRLTGSKPEVFGYTNSYEYTGHHANTTSYFNVLFEPDYLKK